MHNMINEAERCKKEKTLRGHGLIMCLKESRPLPLKPSWKKNNDSLSNLSMFDFIECFMFH